jgi:hypothetical protein
VRFSKANIEIIDAKQHHKRHRIADARYEVRPGEELGLSYNSLLLFPLIFLERHRRIKRRGSVR